MGKLEKDRLIDQPARSALKISIPDSFTAPWWLRNAHCQTIWPSLVRRAPKIVTTRERLELADGDFIDLNWISPRHARSDTPIVIVLHGLGGSITSQYASGILRAIQQHGWRGVLMHFRGCSGEPNRLPRCYHAGETEDFNTLVTLLQQREPSAPLAAIGYSLGGNVLLKWLGERGAQAPLLAAVAVSVPFSLSVTGRRLNQGLSRLYQSYLLRSLRKVIRKKFTHPSFPVTHSDVAAVRTIWEYDNAVTAPLHGFSDADDYYAKSSSRQYLRHIAIPTLILHAADDPFMTEHAIPSQDELSASISFELSTHGGHVAFITGRYPWRPEYWLERRIPNFLATKLGRAGRHPEDSAREIDRSAVPL